MTPKERARAVRSRISDGSVIYGATPIPVRLDTVEEWIAEAIATAEAAALERAAKEVERLKEGKVFRTVDSYYFADAIRALKEKR